MAKNYVCNGKGQTSLRWFVFDDFFFIFLNKPWAYTSRTYFQTYFKLSN